jgi:rhodanese-related sulfurtransferase
MSAGLVAVVLGVVMMAIWLGVWWSEGIRLVRARELLAHGASLIDVDSRDQYVQAHPPGAEHVPLEELARRAPDFGPHEHPIVVYGHGEWRALFAAWRLRAIGFHEVVSVGAAKL